MIEDENLRKIHSIKPVKLLKNQKIHWCVGIYSSLEEIHNGVLDIHLDDHVKYNKLYRPGRALFVDGKCVYSGYLKKDDCIRIENELLKKSIQFDKPTIPYL